MGTHDHSSQKPLSERVQAAARSAADSVEETVDSIKSTPIDQLADKASQKSAEVSTNVAAQVDDAMTTAGEQISNLGQAVREHAPDGKPGEVARSAAKNLERGGEYLQSADVAQVRSDLEQLIRAHPVEALLVGAGIGYLLAKATRR